MEAFAAGCAVGPVWVKAAAQGTDSQENYQAMTLFSDVMARVQADYVEPVPSRKLIDNAMNGMLTGLDPHSSYMTETEWHEMESETSGHFGGIGLELTDKGGVLQVISPIDGTPAAAAGIKPGDMITAVNGKSLSGVSLNDAIVEMRGAPNTRLNLILKRPGVDDPIILTLTRQIIHVNSVTGRLAGDIGVIRISEFTEQTNPGVIATMRGLRTSSGGRLRGLVLDLRNNPGGLLSQAVAVSNDFLVSRRDRLDARPARG